MIQRLASHLLSVVLVIPLLAPLAGASDELPTASAAIAPAAQDASDDSAEAADAAPRDVTFDDLEVLLGAWEASPYLVASGPYRVTSRWERVLGGRFLKTTREVIQGEHVTEEWFLLGLPEGADELELWHFGSDGSSGKLLARPDAELRREGRLSVRDGALWSLAFEGVIRGRVPNTPWRLTVSVYEHGQYDLLIERQPGDNWLPITRQEFVRTAEADEPADADGGADGVADDIADEDGGAQVDSRR